MVKKKKSDVKLKKTAEKREKQLFKSQNKHLKELRRDGVDDIVKTVEGFDINSRGDDLEIQCSIIQSERPSPRISSSYNIHPISGEVIIFGGEYYDGKEVKCFHDLYKWNIDKDEWKQVVIGNTNSSNNYSGGPKPRCSHQAVIFNECLYIHGGEYSTESQFYHFRDLWRLNLKNYTWQEIKTTGLSPTPRSGHRMVVWRHYFVVFGGFHDTIRETRYFNDIHVFDTKTLHWVRIDSSKYESCPSPRSGVQMVLCPNSDRIFIYGGYSKIKDNSKNSVGKTHTDSWFIDMKPFLNKGLPIWERVSKKGNPPSIRSGSTIIGYKNQCIIFGGVFDQDDELGLNLNSTFYNDLYVFEVNNKRWYEIELSKNKIKQEFLDDNQPNVNSNFADVDTHIKDEVIKMNNSEDIDPSDKNLRVKGKLSKFSLKQRNSLNSNMPNDELGEIKASNSEINFENKSVDSPLPRINCGMFVRGNIIYIYGGLFESGKRNITLDDCWCFNILKKDEWVCVLPLSAKSQEWVDSDSDTESNISSGYFSSSNESCYLEEESDVSEQEYKSGENEQNELSRKAIEDVIKKYQLDDSNKTPFVNESIREFFMRTKTYWMNLIMDEEMEGITDGKDLSRRAFLMAKERFDQIKTYINLVGKFENSQTKSEN
ncbi:Galactose oxidase, central domain protein [Cryptosporidium meleagridis]|uniref:Galactose oxidase, central domain protein n=1 Tax=Cryptosporidium meleagridis TaxID=93969 RepID=A0A2P4Z034_9CRYT|nr:Galactose oxidase, central domain protein [Cryptosporidium meleagridis]